MARPEIADLPGIGAPAPTVRARHRDRWRARVLITAAQAAIVAIALCGWQYLPHVRYLRHTSPLFNPFFVSSPEKIARMLWDLLSGSGEAPSLWPYLKATLEATLGGTLIGIVAGAAGGLLLSNSRRLTQIMWPFVTAVNAIPRIALIPIIVIIAGPTLTASIMTAVLVVFFIAFFAAFEGGRSVSRETLQNAKLLGASDWQLMRQLRFPYVLVWTFATLPNAISFGLVATVTAEILTGSIGVGRLLLVAVSTVNSTLTFAVVVILSAVGIVLVTLTDRLRRRWLHWWDADVSP